ncbi:hypothetical protein CLHUN_35240 [Ruminiclostridium hungatei]|uniref:Uncharacterized protein n=1 Tax=Ruminiclostridium hungatei TaxID=48256 RepID=A0A1V4SH15_RUMHU|nr:hypothetical protein [Ruminiclostridium hungatei]OPX42557.1 hypothetical protein CLHUN_35240 [Ruminiclostridium hungatei]
MREKDIIGAINGIHVNPSVKAKVLELGSHRQKPKTRTYRWKSVAAVTLALLFCSLNFGMPFLHDRSKSDPLFDGFAIRTYAASGEEIALSANAVIPLKEYSPLMSSVPGIPFIMPAIGIEADEIHVSVDKGALLTWKAPDGIVEDKGNTYECKADETIYWSPLSKDGTLAKQGKVIVSALKNGKERIRAEIAINQTGNSKYSAEVYSLISKPEKVNRENLKFIIDTDGSYTGFSNLSANYKIQEAENDGYLVTQDLEVIANKNVWDNFVKASLRKENAGIRIVKFYTESADSPYFSDLFYNDGYFYLFDSSSKSQVKQPYLYLKTLEGRFGDPLRDSGAIVLTNDAALTFDMVMKSIYSSNLNSIKDISPFQIVMFK